MPHSSGKPDVPSTDAFKMPPPAGESASPPIAPAFPWRRLALWSALGLPVLLALGTVFYPYDSLRPAMEQAASAALQQPVRFRKVELSILPKPALLLHDMTIDNDAQPLAGLVRIAAPWSLLTSERRIDKLEIHQVRMTADRMSSVPLLQGKPFSTTAFRVDQVVLRNLRVDAAGMSPGELGGEFSLTAGRLVSLSLHTVERELTAKLTPLVNGFDIQFDGYGWRPGEGRFRLDSIRAQGNLKPGQLTLHEVDLRTLGGGIKGSWQLDWSNGVRMRADASVSALDPRQIAAVFAPSLRMDGALSGVLRIAGHGGSADGMLAQLEASLDAEVLNGMLHGVDLGEAARRGGTPVRGGATKFERMKAQVTVQPGLVSFRNIQMASGIFNATGQASAHRGSGAIDGQFNVTIHSTLSSLRANVAVSGRMPDLVANGRY